MMRLPLQLNLHIAGMYRYLCRIKGLDNFSFYYIIWPRFISTSTRCITPCKIHNIEVRYGEVPKGGTQRTELTKRCTYKHNPRNWHRNVRAAIMRIRLSNPENRQMPATLNQNTSLKYYSSQLSTLFAFLQLIPSIIHSYYNAHALRIWYLIFTQV